MKTHLFFGLLTVALLVNGEWLWHPLAWPKQLQLNAFADDHPKGYGLLQRDRDFNHYMDLEALYHKRPSVGVQPLNGFDKGVVRSVSHGRRCRSRIQIQVLAFVGATGK